MLYEFTVTMEGGFFDGLQQLVHRTDENLMLPEDFMFHTYPRGKGYGARFYLYACKYPMMRGAKAKLVAVSDGEGLEI